MKYKNLFVLVIFSMFVFFVSSCSVQSDVSQGDETSKVAGNINKAQQVSASYFYKMNKAASNLSWAAAARIAVVSQRSQWDPYILEKAYQGDMSAKFYGYYNRNAKPYDVDNMRETIREALSYYGGGAHGTNVVPGGGYANVFWRVLLEGVPIIVVRRDKTNYNDFWAVVIYAMPNANGGQETISVWDPEHGWDYTCNLNSFCDDARFYNGYCGQFAIWPSYGLGGYSTPTGYY
jgi:hypothetical protein